MRKKIKALALLSGGLDSLLAARLVADQGIDLVGLTFVSYFFDVSSLAANQAQELGIPLKVVDISQRQLDKVICPEYGYGGGLNPCVDCHLLMIKAAYQYLTKAGADFIVTGDVLGQRPLSQNQPALSLIDRVSGAGGLILRPLSARWLPITKPEERGWVERKKLLAIKGRSRKEQIKLAQKFGLKNYTAPAGGCRLTNPVFAGRLTKVLAHFSRPSANDLQLAAFGRHFWLEDAWLVVGRNQAENEKIAALALPGDYLTELSNLPGPTVLIRGKGGNLVFDQARKLVMKYATKAGRGAKLVLRKISPS